MLAAGVLAMVVYFILSPARTDVRPDADSAEQPVRTELLANTDAVAPGREFLLGVRFRIAPGWYIYRKNPGDAGLPTTVDLALPPGFSMGPVLYPAPVRFTQPGDIVGYGYKEEVVLLVRVAPPRDLRPGQNVTFQAHARWLSCRDICILGEQTLTLPLPVALESRPLLDKVFQKWMNQIPSQSDPTEAAVGPVKE